LGHGSEVARCRRHLISPSWTAGLRLGVRSWPKSNRREIEVNNELKRSSYNWDNAHVGLLNLFHACCRETKIPKSLYRDHAKSDWSTCAPTLTSTESLG
jgi:hypothetical protein